MHVGEAFDVYNILHTTYPTWPVQECNSSTSTRPYEGFQAQPWQVEYNQVDKYIRAKLGNLQLRRDVRASGLFTAYRSIIVHS